MREWLYIGNRFFPTVVFYALHIPLALALKNSSMIGLIHIGGILFIGAVVILGNGAKWAPFVVAYVVAAEVLWRMTHSLIFWEQGKYLVIFLLALALWREGRSIGENKKLLVYFLLLLPSLPLAFFESQLEVRSEISFNLSGPLCLLMCGLYFGGKELELKELRSLLAWSIAPIVGIAFLCWRGLATAETIAFTDESSFLGSGGFGPNQVSSTFGAGVVFLFLLISISRHQPMLQAVGAGLLLWFLAQGFLTFSRGGVVVAVASAMIGTFFILKGSAHRKSAILGGLFILFMCTWYLLPKLNAMTEGMLEVRYQDMDTTGRLELAIIDFKVFLNNPLLGVGPGGSNFYHTPVFDSEVTAHTEITRMLAEHGFFGLLSLDLLLMWLLNNYRTTSSLHQRVIVVSLMTLGLGYMLHAAMRTALVAYVLGLTGVSLHANRSSDFRSS